MDTRTRLLDVAVELVADHGVRGLTHDDVDAAAHAPAGSAQEMFPTRRALVEGVMERCIEATLDGIAEMFGHFVVRALGEDRAVTLTRYDLQAEVARTPGLRTSYAIGADAMDTWASDLLRSAGFEQVEILHKNSCFAAFGGIKSGGR